MYQWSYFSRVMVLWVAGLGAAGQFSKFSLFLPELAQHHPNSGLLLGFLVSVVSLVGALFGLVAGALASQLGLRRLLLIGLLSGAFISILQSFELPLLWLLLSRTLEGASHLMIIVTAPTLIARNSSEQYRSAAMTLWSTFLGVSFALTGWLGLALVSSKGLFALFLVHGLIMGVTALMVVFVIPAGRRERDCVAGSKRSLSFKDIFIKHRQAWTSASISAPAAGWLFYTLTYIALLTILPGLMAPEDRAFTASALPIASLTISITLGVILLSQFSALPVLYIGFLGAIVFVLALAFIPSKPLIGIALFASLGLVQGASFSAIPQLNRTSEHQTLANGALAQAGNIGNLFGTPLLMNVLMAGGIESMVALVVCCYVLAIGAHFYLNRRRQREG